MRALSMLLAVLLVGGCSGVAARQPFVVGDWAGDCKSDFHLGYAQEANGELVAYTVNKGVTAPYARPKVLSEDAQYFTLDFGDGAPPIVWKKEGESMQPWSQGQGANASIKEGMRDGQPTPVFHRCGRG